MTREGETAAKRSRQPTSGVDESQPRPSGARLLSYLITGDSDEETLLRRVERALAAGVDLIQLRRKRTLARELEALAARLLTSFPDARGKLLLNDRLDVALSAGAAGVHLPANGLEVAAVRRIVPPDFLVARSTHRLDEVTRAASEGASFVVFGPVFPTSSKPGHQGVGIERLAEAVSSVSIPVFALGGITPQRVSAVATAGAAGVAGISVFETEESLRALMESLSGC